MRVAAAISLSVSAEWSRENALMTARPLASPPMASRRALLLAGMGRESISVCEERGISLKDRARVRATLDAAGRSGSASSRRFGKRTPFRYAKSPGARGNHEDRFAGAAQHRDFRVQRGHD